MPLLWLHRASKTVTVVTFVLIAAGGLVTSTGSGLSVPDWPLSYGQFFPPMVGGIRFEHTHRVIAGFVGLLTLALMIALLRHEERKWVRLLGVAAFLAVIAQAVLGGLTVIYLLPPAISIFHACLGPTFFCLVASLALFTSAEWKEGRASVASENAGTIQKMLLLTTGLIYTQLIAGAIVRHTEGYGIAIHVVLGFLALFHVIVAVVKTAGDWGARQKLLPHALFIGAATVVQLFLGFGSFITTLMLSKTEMPRVSEVLFTASHQATGALILVACLLLTLRSFRILRP
ncbi:MAG: COX15/CtaA family protein [Candidatus Omnitrophota bacterium]